MIRHVILNGLYDDDNRRDIFSEAALDTMIINNLVAMLEGKELARDATRVPSVSAVSQFKKKQKEVKVPSDFECEGTCSTCNTSIKLFKRMRNGKYNKTAFTDCFDCWKLKNRSGQFRETNGGNDSVESSAVSFEISTNNVSFLLPDISVVSSNNLADPSPKTVLLHHHIFEDGDWRLKIVQPHPSVLLKVSTNSLDYGGSGFNGPCITGQSSKAIVDSGAQCCLWGWHDCRNAGFQHKDVLPVKQRLNGVSKSYITIYGAVILRMTEKSPSVKEHSCAAIVYISPDVIGFSLSREAMIQLHIIPVDFPIIGGALPLNVNSTHSCETEVNDVGKCNCPRRTMPPGLPKVLPFECNPQNAGKMRQWLLERYKSSTFNTCPRQILPDMEGPPISIHVDLQAIPVAVHVPSQIPLHWQEKVKSDPWGYRKGPSWRSLQLVPSHGYHP